ncbi:hypothetical protein [Saccharomonospora xinjiangensis]|uniref:hypothetical protein n=1 Tax=Saccharomonospora xinjiangensis TaxID=75294 RepID=UPI001FFC45F0|nr:hypothetical protein [Saccharomonospora xinjiangensis]
MLHSGRRLLLAGSTADAQRGVWAEARCVVTTELDEESELRAYAHSGSSVFLVAPLLRVVALPQGRRVVVGRIRVSVKGAGSATANPTVRATAETTGDIAADTAAGTAAKAATESAAGTAAGTAAKAATESAAGTAAGTAAKAAAESTAGTAAGTAAKAAAGTPVETAVDVVVQAVWAENDGWHQETELPAGLAEALFAALASPSHLVPDEPQARAMVMAKAFTEGSRNELTRLRAMRYELERRIADLLAQRRTTTLRAVLAEVVELSMAVSRARDQAREAGRSKLHSWLWSDGEPPMAPVHEAALRHCRAMDTELAEEDTRLHSLLSGLSTLAVAQDGEAQQRFNLAAAAVAAGLGLPALILALYGADAVLPLDSWASAWRALLPIGGTTLLAVLLAVRTMPGRAHPRHYATAVVAVLALVAILFVAGALAPAP